MVEGTLATAAESMRGTLFGSDRSFRGVSTDTRTLQPGELFFALEGPNFDGKTFVDVAAEQAAAGAVVSRRCESDLPNITVTDTRHALGELAHTWRQSLPTTVIGVTGSNGKTTVKELIASCLAQSAKTFATRGNFNNDIGMPLMLLSLDPQHRFAVIEMGANHHGEIANLARIAVPDVVLITNAGPAHLEGFGSIEGVSRGKGEILQDASRPKLAVLNADDTYYPYWRSLVEDVDLLTFGIDWGADVTATDIELRANASVFRLCLPQDEVAVTLPLPGAHNVLNACAAAAVAYGLGISTEDIRQGLESVMPVSGRLHPVTGPAGSLLYDDSYNANPVSVIAAAKFIAAEDGTGILVLGDMGELGPDERALHEKVGQEAKKAGVERLLATGSLSRHAVAAFGDGASWYASIEELIADLQVQLRAGSNILVKGSRSMRMERVVDALRVPSRQEG